MKLPELPHLRELNRDDPQELNLVLAGFLRTYTDSSSGVERSVFFKLCEPLVRNLMARSTVVVACMPEAHDAVMGWMMWEGDVLHYVCIKPRWARLGIASWMLKDFAEKPVVYTHITPAGAKLGVPEAWGYRPLLRFPAEAA